MSKSGTVAQVEAATTKKCPDCAEAVQDEALVCRYCGYRFGGTAAPAEPHTRKSPGGAALLGFVIPGLGHFYIGETWRGAVLLVSFGVAVLGAVLTALPGPGLLIGIVAAVDAHRGAKAINAGGRKRDVGAGLWVLLLIVVGLVSYAVVKYDQRQTDYNNCLVRQELDPNGFVICTPP